MTTAKERPDLLRELGLDIQNHASPWSGFGHWFHR